MRPKDGLLRQVVDNDMPQRRAHTTRVEIPHDELMRRVQELIESSRKQREIVKDLHEATKALHKQIQAHHCTKSKR
jgi:hypothetical protein